jgi:hypothetical protein
MASESAWVSGMAMVKASTSAKLSALAWAWAQLRLRGRHANRENEDHGGQPRQCPPGLILSARDEQRMNSIPK